MLSREVEASADSFALRLTHDPRRVHPVRARIAVRNISDPDPPGVWQILFGTHPTTVQRIGIGKAYDETRTRLPHPCVR